MRILKKLPILLFLAALLISGASMALAAPLISISSSGNGVFTLQGSGFASVGGINLTIRYDTTTLANPRVAQGGLISGSMMMPNATIPGTIILGVIDTKGISGTGPLATITFDLPGSSPGVIQSLTITEFIDHQGAKLASQTQINNPSGETKNTPAITPTQTDSTASTSGGTATPVMVGGTVTMPTEGESAKEKQREEVPPAAATSKKEPAVAAMAKKEPAVAATAGESEPSGSSQQSKAGAPGEKSRKQSVSYRSVLEQFQTFSGVKTPKTLIAIFEQNVMEGIRQEPRVVLSDGDTTAKVFITPSSSEEKEAPNFALTEAKLVSLKMEEKNTWVIELLPAKGVYKANIRMLLGGEMTEIPVTVAPPISKEMEIGKQEVLTEADFIMFLKERGTDKAPRFDLDGNGKRDYIDDYIFTANYLVKSSGGKR